MYKFIALVCLLSILAMAQAPTRLAETQIATPVVSFTALRVLTPTGWIYVQPDSTIQIDLAANPPVIRAILGREIADKFVVTTAVQTFTLSASLAPNATLTVYRNGLLMAEVTDYTLTGRDVLFLPQQPVSPGDIIQLRYKTLQ